MSYPSFGHPTPITIIRRVVTGTDDFGNDVYGETSENVTGSVAPSTSRENLNQADQLTSGIVVMVPFGTDVEYIDAIVVNGTRYEVSGQPDTWTSPFSGNTAPVRIEGTLVVGAG